MNSTIEDLLEVVQRDDEGKFDFPLVAGDMRMTPEFELQCPDGTAMSLSTLAASQLAAKVGIPSKFLRRTRDADGGQTMAAMLTDFWLGQQPADRKFTVRAKEWEGGKRVRGILGPNYLDTGRYNNSDLVQATYDAIEIAGVNAQCTGYHLSSESFWADVTFPDFCWDPDDDGGIVAGCKIGNSEVGLRSVVFLPFTLRLLCVNGLVGRAAKEDLELRIPHRGISRAFITNLLGEKILAVLRASDEMFELFRSSRELPMPDIGGFIQSMQRKWDKAKLTDKLAEEWKALVWGKAVTMFDVVNGLTAVANLYSGDRKVEVQTMAGALLAEHDELAKSFFAKVASSEMVRTT